MKGSEQKLIAFMQGASNRFVIPVYQRNYDWKTENCRQLYDDLIKVIRMDRKSHFFGSIVNVYNPDGEFNEFQIIDGQQRLTTVSLLLLAMYKLMKNDVIVSESKNLAEKIYKTYLIDEWQDDDTRIKLKPVKNDRTAFDKLFMDSSKYIQASNLTINYEYFYNRIQKEEISIDQLYAALSRLEIINIQLNQDDNPQLIFESLNSTGLDLSEGDKIRNFILMGLPSKEQNNYYENYWNPIEECAQYDVSSFIRDYLSVKQQTIPSQKKIYVNFKEYVEPGKIETESLLKDLLAYAKRYEQLLIGGTKHKELDACIYRLNRLESTVTRPFFLEIFRLYDEGKLDISQVTDIFLTTENYLFRRTICGLPTNVLNKIFLILHKEIVRYDGTENDYVGKFKYTLLSKKERARFPDDNEFGTAFTECQIYLMNSKNKIYMLERLENFGTAEDKDVYRHYDAGEYSIEHIMPQHLTPAWVKALGDDYEQIHETWLHRIANLTLTAVPYNAKYSNKSFDEKKAMKNGYKDTGIRLTAYIAQKDKWTLAELEERSAYLMERALQTWGFPETAFKPEDKQMDSYSLDDDVTFSGRIIAKFSYKNMEQPVSSWIDMYECVLKILHEEDKTILSKLAYAANDSSDLAVYIRHNPADLRGAIEIDEGIYAERNTSTWLKVSVLRRFFKLYDADPADLVFYLRDESENNKDDISGTRYELRKRYWTFALEYIHKAHGEDGSFQNVNPTTTNWIGGFFGVRGMSICCVANYDSVRVELYFGKAKKEENKKAFDALITHKKEIETALGCELKWNRGDGIKSSKVSYQLENVSIENETDWLQMARFHAEWSRKFFDVIVPYILGAS